jgi:hypothetical protein
MKKSKKIMILDGISGTTLGEDLSEAFIQIGVNCNYVSLRKLKRKRFFKIRSKLGKFISFFKCKKSFYQYPKVNKNQ